MQWVQILAFLACPLMMLFCMKGMFSGKGRHNHTNGGHSQGSSTSEEVKSLQIKVAELMEQNHHLSKEIQPVKQTAQVAEQNGEQGSLNRVIS